jgi:hypothetical protein
MNPSLTKMLAYMDSELVWGYYSSVIGFPQLPCEQDRV